jgi:polar amino acid transport system substrate-binding protein
MSLIKIFCIPLLVLLPLKTYPIDSLKYVYSSFPPYMYTDNSGQPKGILVEIIEKVFSKANVKIEMYENPNRRANKLVNDGSLTFSVGPTFMLDNPNDFLIGKDTLEKIDLNVYWHGELQPVRNIEDLIGHSIILMAAYRYDGLREFAEDRSNRITIALDAENHLIALQALKAGRGDYLIDYGKPIEYELTKEPYEGLYFNTISTFESKFLILRSAPHAEEIMQRIEKAYEEIYLGK